MGSIVIHDGMDRFTGRDGAFDFVEEADEFLMSVALHILPQDCSVEHIKGGKQCRRPVAFIVVGHRGRALFLYRQAGLGAVEGLDLTLLIDREHYGMGRRRDI